jgi:hypothetical protein
MKADKSGNARKSYTLPSSLKSLGKKITSQTDEDGIIEAIFNSIPPRSSYFVEFGIGPHWEDREYINGLEGNCVNLRNKNWSGLFMDGGDHPPKYDIKKEFIEPTNVNTLFRKHGVPKDVDVISIDVDGQDYWIFMACYFRPILFIVEYNPNFANITDQLTVPFDQKFRWDGTKYYGASLGALNSLAVEKGYVLVYANGVNAFFVDRELLANLNDFDPQKLNVSVDMHAEDRLQRKWQAV